jgi:K+ transporter
VIASEIIDHLPKEDGYKMMDEIERVSRKLVIITTPIGFMKQEATEGNIHQEHQSGWHSTEFTKRGYSVEIANTRMMTRMARMVDTMRRVVFNLKKRPNALIAVKTLSKADSDRIMKLEENLMSDPNMETPMQLT